MTHYTEQSQYLWPDQNVMTTVISWLIYSQRTHDLMVLGQSADPQCIPAAKTFFIHYIIWRLSQYQPM